MNTTKQKHDESADAAKKDKKPGDQIEEGPTRGGNEIIPESPTAEKPAGD